MAVVFIGCYSEQASNSSRNETVPSGSTKSYDQNTNVETVASGTEKPDDFKGKTWTIQGVVVNQNNKSIDDYDAASVWSSNGRYWNAKGEVSPEKRESIWKNEGVLANRQQYSAQQTSGGKFSLKINDRPRAPVFAINTERTHGGIELVHRESSRELITIKMSPLVRVNAKLFCPESGTKPSWGRAEIYLVGSDNIYLTSCGTYKGRVSFLLPPGHYEITARGSSPESKMNVPPRPKHIPLHGEYTRGKRFTVPNNVKELNLGVLELALQKDASGNSLDTTKLFGNLAPKLNISDARGVPKDVKLEDFRGKWVLVDFWAIWCSPCVKNSLPELVEFYSKHKGSRDKFEILAICNTSKENISTIEEYEKRIAKIRNSHWGGKFLPFPVLLDSEGKTYKNYGVANWPTTYLIDPSGRIVKGGNLKMLSDQLQKLHEKK